jgi:outer membrane receptor protein involved in Fe transport
VVNSVVSIGNPNLKSGRIDKISMEYKNKLGRLDVGLDIYANRSRRAIIQSYSPLPNDPSILFYTYLNSGRGAKQGIEASANLRFSPQGTLNVDLDAYHQRYNSSMDSMRYPGSIFTYTAKMDFTWTPTGAGTFQFQVQSYGKELIPGGQKLGYHTANVSYAYQFSPTLKVSVNVNNVLDSTRYVELVDVPAFTRRSELTVPGAIIYAGLSYKFREAAPGSRH